MFIICNRYFSGFYYMPGSVQRDATRAGGVAQVAECLPSKGGPEFKLQYHKKRKNKIKEVYNPHFTREETLRHLEGHTFNVKKCSAS
jgi:hypothetical protein